MPLLLVGRTLTIPRLPSGGLLVSRTLTIPRLPSGGLLVSRTLTIPRLPSGGLLVSRLPSGGLLGYDLYQWVPPQLPQELLKISVDNFGPGIREQVKKSLDEARRNPRDANAVGRLGMVLQTYEDHELAATCYLLAHRLEPKDFRWTYLLGISQSALGKQREAVAALRDALRLKPEDLPAQLKLADALHENAWRKPPKPFGAPSRSTRNSPRRR